MSATAVWRTPVLGPRSFNANTYGSNTNEEYRPVKGVFCCFAARNRCFTRPRRLLPSLPSLLSSVVSADDEEDDDEEEEVPTVPCLKGTTTNCSSWNIRTAHRDWWSTTAREHPLRSTRLSYSELFWCTAVPTLVSAAALLPRLSEDADALLAVVVGKPEAPGSDEATKDDDEEDEEEEDEEEEDEVEEDTFGFLWEVNEVTMTRDRFFRSRFSTKFKRKFSSL